MDQPDKVTAEFYLLFEPTWNRINRYWQDDDGNPILAGAKCRGVTQNRPNVGRNGGVVVRMRANFKAQTFLPLMPTAILEIDPSNAEVVEVTVEEPVSE